MTKMTRTEYALTFTTDATFDVVDEKGRRLGLRTTIHRVTFVEDARGTWVGEPGTRFYLCAQQTRDGKKYGALQPNQVFETEAKAMAAVLMIEEERGASYLKKYGAM